jgi:hypothetical protein
VAGGLPPPSNPNPTQKYAPNGPRSRSILCTTHRRPRCSGVLLLYDTPSVNTAARPGDGACLHCSSGQPDGRYSPRHAPCSASEAAKRRLDMLASSLSTSSPAAARHLRMAGSASLPSQRRSVPGRWACAARLHGWWPCRPGRPAADGQVSLIPKLTLSRSATRHLRLHVSPAAVSSDARREHGCLGLPHGPLHAHPHTMPLALDVAHSVPLHGAHQHSSSVVLKCVSRSCCC